MSGDIIVTGRPFAVFSQTDYYPFPSGGSAGGAGLAYGQMVADDLASKDNVKVDDDVKSDDIVIVARKIKEDISRLAVSAAINGTNPVAGVNVPCVGLVTYSEVTGNAKNMTFRLTSQDFGPGRAGENLAGSSGVSVPINVNANSALSYSHLTNGTMYLVAHEIAHSLYIMQQFDNQQWQQFVQRVGPGYTEAQLKQAYPDSPEFKANEMRANSVAKALAQALGFGAMLPDPTNGYATC